MDIHFGDILYVLGGIIIFITAIGYNMYFSSLKTACPAYVHGFYSPETRQVIGICDYFKEGNYSIELVCLNANTATQDGTKLNIFNLTKENSSVYGKIYSNYYSILNK